MEGSHTALAILIVVGILIWLFLLATVFALWKVRRLKMLNGDTRYSMLNVKHKGSNAFLSRDYDETIDEFGGFPASYCTIPVQTSISQYDAKQEKNCLNRDRSFSANSLHCYDLKLNDNYWASPLSPVEEKQNKTCEGVITHLVRQGRKVSEVDLRYGSPSKDTPRASITSENSGTTSMTEEELCTSNTIGVKKKLAGRRLQRQNEVAGCNIQPKKFKKAGRISLTTQYIEREEKLVVNLLNASELTPKRHEYEINPFVVASLKPGKKQKQQTQICQETKEPVFNKKMIFTKLKKDELLKHMLKIVMKNQVSPKKSEYLGEVSIALHSIDHFSEQTFDATLCIERAETAMTSIQLSLCHKPTNSKLQVLIKSVKNLPKRGTSGTYVTLMLFKENEILRYETSTKRNTRDPVYNESFEFDVYTDSITPLSTYSLVVSLNNHNMVGKDEVFGHIIFNKLSPHRSTIDQWRLTEDVPYQEHVSWHSIVDPAEL